MKVKCEYCGAMIDDTASFCPNCGAPNQNMKRTADHTPKTIEELKQWYEARHLPPPETTRFFIGVDYKEPRAFGIYKNGNECVVYKNKDDGTRAIRYQGDDEAYAVNEIYLKLKSEILNQKARNQKKGGSGGNSSGGCGCVQWVEAIASVFLLLAAGCFSLIAALIIAGAAVAAYFIIDYLLKKRGKDKNGIRKTLPFYLMIFVIVASLAVILLSPSRSSASYYSYRDEVYAKYDDSYYIYDPVYFDYYPIDTYYVPSDVLINGDEYEFNQDSGTWDSSYMFEDSDYYETTIEPQERSSDDNDSDWSNDSDWDWDSGDSWDSGGSDWGSDW